MQLRGARHAPTRASISRSSARVQAPLTAARRLAPHSSPLLSSGSSTHGLRSRCSVASPTCPTTYPPASPPAPATAVEVPPLTAPSAASAPPAPFVWAQNWYPVAATEFLDPSRPHAFTLLGRKLVLWRDGAGAWRAFEDACPHRLAPLSEGRVEKDGTLLCAYHAWRFDGSGACTSIPQAASPEAQARACANPRSCATSYPIREVQGLLWVWGEAGPTGRANSDNKEPATLPELELPESRRVSPAWSFRDLPYSHDYFIENVTDPAHAPVSHHGIVGSRYHTDQYIDVDEERPLSPTGGFKYRVKQRTVDRAFGRQPIRSSTEFVPPCQVRITAEFDDGSALILALYSTPTTPGRCRHIGRQILLRDRHGQVPKGLGIFALPMPTWMMHTLAATFMHQDQVFLHFQEREVLQQGGHKYFMPTPADNMTTTFRKWMSDMAGGAIPYGGTSDSSASAPLPLSSKSFLFDTYEAHTANCSACSAALKKLEVARGVALAAAAVGVLAAAVITAVAASAQAAALAAAGAPAASAASAALLSLPPAGALVAAGLAAVGGAAAVVVGKIIGMMHRYEFAHADNH